MWQELFVGHGGQLLDNHKVTRIIPSPVVTVETEKASFRAKRVIVTAGAWTNQLLQHTGLSLPLKVYYIISKILIIHFISLPPSLPLSLRLSPSLSLSLPLSLSPSLSLSLCLSHHPYLSPCKPTRTELLYWKVEEAHHYTPSSFPVFGYHDTSQIFYGQPIMEYPGLVKVSTGIASRQ